VGAEAYKSGRHGVAPTKPTWREVTSAIWYPRHQPKAEPILGPPVWTAELLMICLGCSDVRCFLCAKADSINSLLLFRVLQGLAGVGGHGNGAGVASILAEPPAAEARTGVTLFRVAGGRQRPVVGPTLGGWLADPIHPGVGDS